MNDKKKTDFSLIYLPSYKKENEATRDFSLKDKVADISMFNKTWYYWEKYYSYKINLFLARQPWSLSQCCHTCSDLFKDCICAVCVAVPCVQVTEAQADISKVNLWFPLLLHLDKWQQKTIPQSIASDDNHFLKFCWLEKTCPYSELNILSLKKETTTKKDNEVWMVFFWLLLKVQEEKLLLKTRTAEFCNIAVVLRWQQFTLHSSHKLHFSKSRSFKKLFSTGRILNVHRLSTDYNSKMLNSLSICLHWLDSRLIVC